MNKGLWYINGDIINNMNKLNVMIYTRVIRVSINNDDNICYMNVILFNMNMISMIMRNI